MQIKWDSFPFLMIDVLCEEENPNIWAQDYVWIPLLAALKCVLRWFQYPFQILMSKTNSYFFPSFFPCRSEKIYYYPEACKSAQIYYPVLIKFICWFIHFTPLKKTELKALQKLCGDGVTILFLSLWAISQPCLIPTAKASHSSPTCFVCTSKMGIF